MGEKKNFQTASNNFIDFIKHDRKRQGTVYLKQNSCALGSYPTFIYSLKSESATLRAGPHATDATFR